VRDAAKVGEEPIVLKNSVPERERPKQQNFLPPIFLFANIVFGIGSPEKNVPKFSGDFRRSEFFNTISASRS
jgi:hypothetical protein